MKKNGEAELFVCPVMLPVISHRKKNPEISFLVFIFSKIAVLMYKVSHFKIRL
jgi:hypothetical protein